MDLDGVFTMEYFEVIDIVDNTTPYQTLFILDWKFYNQAIINLKTQKVIFESREYRVIAQLDRLEGEIYVEPTIGKFIIEEINQFYNTIVCKEDYIKPKTYGIIRWRSISYFS